MWIYKLIVIFLFVKYSSAFDIPRNGCPSDLKINNNSYNLSDTYRIGEGNPTDAHYDVFGNLFFIEFGRNNEGYFYNAYMVKSKTSFPERIPGLPESESYSVAVDKKDTKVYFGTGKGIYKYDYAAHSATPITETSFKLDMIFIDKDGNKYVTENNDGVQELYLFDGMKKIRFNSLEAFNELAIDDRNNMYYIKEEKLFVLKSTLSRPMCIGNVSYDGTSQIEVHNDKVFVAGMDLVYYHENETGDLKLVENTPTNITAIAFDKTGDFILGVRGKILRYMKNECPPKINTFADDGYQKL